MEAERLALEDKKKKAESKGKKLSKADQSKLDKVNEELEALRNGATINNIAEYKKYWEWIYSHQAKYNQGKLSKSEQKTWDEYKSYINKFQSDRADQLKSFDNEMKEQLDKLKIEMDTKLGELEGEETERLADAYNILKQIAEFDLSDLQHQIDQLDATVSHLESVANLLDEIDLGTIAKYNLDDLLGVDTGQSWEDIMRDQLLGASLGSKTMIESLKEQAQLYQDLIDSASGPEKSFENVLGKYLKRYEEEGNTEMYNQVKAVIARLNEKGYSPEEWKTEWEQGLGDVINKIIETVKNVQELADQLREVNFKAIKQAMEMNESVINRLSSMAGVIEDNWIRDANGLTEFAYAKANLLGQQMSVAQDQVSKYAAMIQKIDEAQANEETRYATEEEYLKARNEALSNYYSSITSLEGVANQLYEIGKQAQEEEINNIKKIIDLRKKELQKRKELYDYDKRLKEQTKSVEALQAQVDALNGVNDLPYLFNCWDTLRDLYATA